MPRPTLLSTLSALLLAAASSSVAHAKATDDFIGKGYIYVLGNDNLAKASPADRIGCLNENGVLTTNQCAVFTRQDEAPFTLSTSAGNCTFANKNTPANSDSIYGQDSHAWSCREDNGDARMNRANYYTVDGFSHPFVCTGNVRCYFEIGAPPSADSDARSAGIPVWQYFWGSQQMGVTPGHLKVIWLWVPLEKTIQIIGGDKPDEVEGL